MGNQPAKNSNEIIKRLSPLALAAYEGNKIKVAGLVKKYNVNKRDRDGRTPIHWAATNGHTDICKMLKDAGAELDIGDKVDGSSPLNNAVHGGHYDTAMCLLDNGAPINLHDNEHRSALHFAAHRGDIKMGQLLLFRKASRNAQDSEGRTPLHWAVFNGHKEFAELMVEKGAEVNVQDNAGRTPLIYSAHMGHIEVMRLLLDAGANPNVADQQGMKTLDHANFNKHKNCVDYLVDRLKLPPPDEPPPDYQPSAAAQQQQAERAAEKAAATERATSAGAAPSATTATTSTAEPKKDKKIVVGQPVGHADDAVEDLKFEDIVSSDDEIVVTKKPTAASDAALVRTDVLQGTLTGGLGSGAGASGSATPGLKSSTMDMKGPKSSFPSSTSTTTTTGGQRITRIDDDDVDEVLGLLGGASTSTKNDAFPSGAGASSTASKPPVSALASRVFAVADGDKPLPTLATGGTPAPGLTGAGAPPLSAVGGSGASTPLRTPTTSSTFDAHGKEKEKDKEKDKDKDKDKDTMYSHVDTSRDRSKGSTPAPKRDALREIAREGIKDDDHPDGEEKKESKKALNAEIRRLQNELADKDAELEATRDLARDAKRDAEKMVWEKEKEVKAVQKEKEYVETELGKLKVTFNLARREIETLKETESRKKTPTPETPFASVSDAADTGDLKRLEEEVNRLETDLEEARNKIASNKMAYELELSRVKASAKTSHSASSAETGGPAFASLQTENGTLKAKVKALEDEKDALRAEMSRDAEDRRLEREELHARLTNLTKTQVLDNPFDSTDDRAAVLELNARLEELRGAKMGLEGDMGNLTRKYDKLKAQLTEEQRQTASLKHQLRSDADLFQQQISDLEAQLAARSAGDANAASLTRQLGDLNRSLEASEREAHDAKARAKDAQAHVARKDEEAARAQAGLTAAKAEAAELQAALKARSDDAERLRGEMERMRGLMGDLEGAVVRAQKDAGVAAAAAVQARTENESKISEARAERDRALDEASKMRGALHLARSQAGDSASRAAQTQELETELERVREELASTNLSLSSLKQTVDKERFQHEAALADARSTQQSATADVEVWRNAATKEQAETAAAKAKQRELEKELATALAQVVTAEGKLSAMGADATSNADITGARLKAGAEREEKLRMELAQVTGELDESKAEVQKLQLEKTRLESQAKTAATTATSQREALLQQVQDAEAAAQAAQTALEAARTEARTAKQQASELSRAASSHQAAASSHGEEVSRLESELSATRTELAAERERAGKLQGEVAAAQGKLRSGTSSVDELSNQLSIERAHVATMESAAQRNVTEMAALRAKVAELSVAKATTTNASSVPERAAASPRGESKGLIDTLQNQLAQARAQIDTLTAQLEGARRGRTEAETALSALRSEMDILSSRVASNNSVMASPASAVAPAPTQERALAELTKERTAIAQEKARVQRNLAEAVTKVSALEASLRERSTLLNQTEQERNEALMKVAVLTAQLDANEKIKRSSGASGADNSAANLAQLHAHLQAQFERQLSSERQQTASERSRREGLESEVERLKVELASRPLVPSSGPSAASQEELSRLRQATARAEAQRDVAQRDTAQLRTQLAETERAFEDAQAHAQKQSATIIRLESAARMREREPRADSRSETRSDPKTAQQLSALQAEVDHLQTLLAQSRADHAAALDEADRATAAAAVATATANARPVVGAGVGVSREATGASGAAAASDAVARVTRELETAKVEMSSIKARHARELDVLRTREQQLLQDNHDLEFALTKAERRLDESQAALMAIEARLSRDAAGSAHNLSGSVGVAAVELDAANDALRAAQDEKRRVEAGKRAAEANLAQATRERAALRQQVDDLTARLRDRGGNALYGGSGAAERDELVAALQEENASLQAALSSAANGGRAGVAAAPASRGFAYSARAGTGPNFSAFGSNNSMADMQAREELAATQRELARLRNLLLEQSQQQHGHMQSRAAWAEEEATGGDGFSGAFRPVESTKFAYEADENRQPYGQHSRGVPLSPGQLRADAKLSRATTGGIGGKQLFDETAGGAQRKRRDSREQQALLESVQAVNDNVTRQAEDVRAIADMQQGVAHVLQAQLDDLAGEYRRARKLLTAAKSHQASAQSPPHRPITAPSTSTKRSSRPHATPAASSSTRKAASKTPHTSSKRTKSAPKDAWSSPDRASAGGDERGDVFTSGGGKRWTPLHQAAVTRDSVQLSNLLARDPSAASALDDNGATAAHWAAYSDSVECLEALLMAPTSVDAVDAQGRSLLYWAVSAGAAATVQLLLDQGADPNLATPAQATTLHKAAFQGDKNIVKLLLKGGALLNAAAATGSTALHKAAFAGHAGVVKQLLRAGCDPNLKDRQGRTALDKACANQHADCIALLSQGD